jgi:phosphoribosylanthranilate isomerase
LSQVKICGINDEAAFDTAVDAGADYVGFVFFARSPRHVTPARAAELSARHCGGPARVGLFVQPDEDDIAAALAALDLDVLQLYVGADRAAALRRRFGLPVWRAVGVSAAADLPRDAGGSDALVIETRPPPGATRPGGNAAAFDWAILAGWTVLCPWVLAGGLTAENVAAAIRITGAPMVDVSSGVERAPGRKDPTLIRAFITAAKAAG